MEDSGPTLYCATCLTTFGSDGQACPNLGCGRPRPEEGWGRMYQPDDVIDRNYKVVKMLALGGAGVTYLVRGLDDDGEPQDPLIALKLLFASRDHGSYLQRLATEAQILQQLNHPNIVQYLGFVHRTGQSPYLLTRFEEGGSLLDHMRRVGTLSIKAAARVGLQVCYALEMGHSKDIIHRDLKPENMLLSHKAAKGEDVEVRVADFGIAKVHGSLGTGLTRTGAFVGTPQYAAPEQFVGEQATPAADVYSVGAVLVFLMTAKPIIRKSHLIAPEDVYLELQDRLPATVQRNKDSEDDNRRMNQILARVMAFDKDQRCSVPELMDMLEALLDDRDIGGASMLDPSGTTPLLSVPPLEVDGPGEVAPSETVEDASEAEEPGPHAPIEDLSDTSTIDDPTPQSASEAPEAPQATESPSTTTPPIRRAAGVASGLGGSALRAVFVLGLMGALAGVGWVWWAQPWHLDGLPVVGADVPHSIKGVSTETAKIKRRTLKGKLRKVVRDAWKACAETRRPSGEVVMEVVVEPSGQLRWMRPGRTDAPATHHCVGRHARGEQINGWSAKRPIHARIKLEF